MAGFATTVGVRYARSRKGFVSVVTAFSFLGIALGVAALLVVTAVMAGFRAELLDRILGTTGHAQVSVPGLTVEKAFEVKTELENLPMVKHAVPYIAGQAMLASPGRATGALVRGLSEDSLKAHKLIAKNIIAGTLEGFEESTISRPKVILGKDLAAQLNVYVGERVNLMSSEGVQTIAGFIPRMMQAEVSGIFEVGMYQYDSALLFLPIKSAQNFYKLGNLVTAIEVHVQNPGAIKTVAPFLKEPLGHGGHVTTWMDANRQFFEALQVERVAMFIILSLIVVVAAFNIITGQMMTVNEKRYDIAILRTMGATQADILRLFFFSGFWVGLVGTVLGTALGLLIIWQLHPIVSLLESAFGVQLFSGQVYFLTNLPAKFALTETILIITLSLGLSVVASFYPAWRATRLNPVEALRNE